MPAVTPTSVGAVDTPDVLPVDQATAIAATQSYAQQSLDASNSARDWATKTSGEVVIGQGYGAKKYAQDAAAAVVEAQGDLDASVALAHDWATKTFAEVVAGQGYGAKKYAADSAAALQSFLEKYVGAFSSAPSYVGGSPPWVTGALYWNTLSGKFYVWSGSAWGATDATTIAAAQAASDSAAAAAASAGTATGARDTTTAARDVTLAARDVATGARDTALSYSNAATSAYNNANALLSSVSAYAVIAQQAAASALVATNLSILAAAQRAIKISSALVAGAAVPYDTTKDEVSDWPRKCVSQSYLSDTLNTATRGTVAAVPAQMVVMGETTVLSVFMGTDGLGALWKSWTVAGLTCVFARSGSIWYGGTGGLYRLDLITDEVYKRDTSGLWLCINQKVADYNQGTATWSLVSSAGAIASATVNSVSAYTADMTQSVKARFGLPNPTVAVGTNAGLSVIRWDGFVSNSASTQAYLSVAFDSYGNLWSLYNGGALYACSPATYQAASFNITALANFSLAQLLISSPSKITACGPGMVAVAGSNGLATLKLDPTNPANSLYRVKTTTYDSGWMVLGKTVLAMAESSANLATLSGGTATDRSGSGNNPNVVGSLSRAQVASGADTAAYGGFSSANYFRLSHVSALDQGTNDFAVMCPITFPATGSYSTICHYSDEAGSSYGSAAFWYFRVEYNGILAAVFFDGTTTQAVISTTTVPTSGVHNVAFARRGQWGELYLDGVRIARTSLGSLGSLSNASANLLIGVTYYNGTIIYPAVGKIGKLRLFNYAPTPDQFAFMMADEAGSNVANAKELLSGANVQGVAYDPDTCQLAASNSTGGTDVFAGPGFSVRVANWKSSGITNQIHETNFMDCMVGATATGANLAFGTIRQVDGVPSGVTATCVGRGFINGSGYVDVQLSGTPGASGNIMLYAQSYQTGANLTPFGVAAASGQQWTGGLGVALAAGSLTNLGAITLSLGGFSSVGGLQEVSYSGTIAPTGAIARTTVTRTLNVGATAQVALSLTVPLTSGLAINATIRLYQPNLQTGAADAFRDGLTANDNHKAVAFMGGDLVVATGAGVDAFLAVKPGLRETAGGVGAPRRPFYDPTFGIFSLVTTDATPTVAVSTPIPEGKAYRIRDTVSFVQVGGVATEKAAYVAEALVTRDLGGNVVVSATTTTISETTASMDYVIQANTTAQTCEGKPTGKASTCGMWVIEREVYDAGLQTAA